MFIDSLSGNRGPPNCVRPGLDHICVRLGPAPPTPPSLSGLPAYTCVRNYSSLGTNVTIPSRNYKYKE